MFKHPLLDELLKEQEPDVQDQVRETFQNIPGNFEFGVTIQSASNEKYAAEAGDLGLAVVCLTGPNISCLFGTAVLDEKRIDGVVEWINRIAIAKTGVVLLMPKRSDEELHMGKCMSFNTRMGIPFNNAPCVNDAAFFVRFDDGIDSLQNHPFCMPCFNELLTLFRTLTDRIEQTSSFTYVLHVQ